MSGDSVEDLLLGTAVRSLGRLLQDLCSRSRASKEFGGWSGSVNPHCDLLRVLGFWVYFGQTVLMHPLQVKALLTRVPEP